MSVSGFDFTGSLWPLLLLPPGLLILWMQLPPGFWRGSRLGFPHSAIFLLQGTALTVLTLSLCAPEWRQRATIFHPPAIIIAVDGSDSFEEGRFLRVGKEVNASRERIARDFAARGFRVVPIRFHEWADDRSGSDFFLERGRLTDFYGLEKFLDTLGVPNIQGIFLFSDGRHTLNSERNFGGKVPIFPVIHPLTGVDEGQLEAVEWIERSGGRVDSLRVTWSPIGDGGGAPRLQLTDGERILLEAELPEPMGMESQQARIPWAKPLRDFGNTGATITAVLIPGNPEGNLTPHNDSLRLNLGESSRQSIQLLLPLRTLEERTLVDALRRETDISLNLVREEEFLQKKSALGGQVWVSAQNFSGSAALRAFLSTTEVKVLLYSPGEFDSRLQPLLMAPADVRSFSESALLQRIQGPHHSMIPEGVGLGKVSETPLKLPLERGMAWSAISLREGDHKGVLLGALQTRDGVVYRHFVLPRVWSRLFTPRPNFGSEALWRDLVRFAVQIASYRPDAAELYLPPHVVAGIPFDLSVRLPPKVDAKASVGTRLRVESSEDVRDYEGIEERGRTVFPNLVLPEGKAVLEIFTGSESKVRDSLEVTPRILRELFRIGYDEPALSRMASAGGGNLLYESQSAPLELPALPVAEMREIRDKTILLYNTRVQLLLVAFLLACSWLLRKRLNLD